MIYPCFLALSNKAGIACAADADHTVFCLSKEIPVALAVNPASKIPWGALIQDYRRTGLISEHETLVEYAADFSTFLASVPVQDEWADLPSDEMNLIFLGFGSGDIFPSAYDVCAEVRDGHLCLAEGDLKKVGTNGEVLSHYLGDFDNVATLIWGATEQSRSFFFLKEMGLFETYAQRVRDRFRGTEYEAYVEARLNRFDAPGKVLESLDRATGGTYSAFQLGVGAFSVEDMVSAVETLVSANAKLAHLKSGAKGSPASVKEIAVLTIPEGLSWIKHSLYKRREEL